MTMELETQVAPDAATQIQAPEATAQPEVAAPEPETPAQPQADAEPQQGEDKTVKRMERRISRLVAEREQAKAEKELAQREWEATRQRLAQYEQPQQEQPQQVDPVALATQIARIKEVDSKSNQIAKDGEKRFGKDEFTKAVQTVFDEAGPLFRPIAPGAQISVPTPLGEAVLESDDPAAVLKYLGSNPEVASEFHGLTPLQAARRIARIEIELSAEKGPRQSSAPKPVTPVKGSAPVDPLSTEKSPEAWRAAFLEQRAKRVR